MKTMSKSLFAASALALVLAATACDDDEPTGTLQQNWTIAGARNPEACARFGASQLRLVVIDPVLDVEATEFVPCSAFTITLPLLVDAYTGTVTMLDERGIAVSDTLSVTPFFISEDLTTTQNVDFAPDDFVRQ